MDCNGEGYLVYGTRYLETDECQEAVEEWTDSVGLYLYGYGDEGSLDYRDSYFFISEDEVFVLEVQDQEEGVYYCFSEEGYQDYYFIEVNGNVGSIFFYRSRRGDGDLEDQEEDIDQIVVEIKMSLSMISIISAGEVSFEYGLVRGFESGFGDFIEVCLFGEVSYGFSRYEGRFKLLNFFFEIKYFGDFQRGFKIKIRILEERLKWF